ncbi:MAG TPA: hypothetical protein VMI06_13110 [Terriglobia bacterium]|nr:hypothetical protein [Terriglobia bacterium]
MEISHQPYNSVVECSEPACDYERERWAAWYAQKPLRRKIGRIAVAHGLTRGYVELGIRDPRRLYKSLSALTPQEVRKYGELRTNRRRERPSDLRMSTSSTFTITPAPPSIQSPIDPRNGGHRSTAGRSG